MPQFSLLNLLALTAVLAIGMAAGTAYRKHRSLLQYRETLLSLSSRLLVEDADKLASSALPKVAGNFNSWNVHIPAGEDYELRLGLGKISTTGIPPIAAGVKIPAGRHRVTLYAGDSPSEEYRFVVYVDGEQAIEQTMGSDWMPEGWSSAGGIGWPREPERDPAPLQLAARSYTPRLDFGEGRGRYFNGGYDNFVTRNGYRLWIDASDNVYQSGSPMIGIGRDPAYKGIGLRDGLRFRPISGKPYEWDFTRPSLESNDPAIRIAATFFAGDDVVLSSNSQTFQSWRIRNDATGQDALSWEADPKQLTYSAFLHPLFGSVDSRAPVVEIMWDTNRPDEAALRLADTPANDEITRWRLRLLGGTDHLWRQLKVGDRTITAGNAGDNGAATPTGETIWLDLATDNSEDTVLKWQTNETLPLQIVERTKPPYAGMGLYGGLPLSSGMRVPAELKPTLRAKALNKDPMVEAKAFPGGAVFEEIEVDLKAGPEWIWLQAKPMEQPPSAQ
ncbi:hypothetical protein [Posidoniimonas polymericola]|nr:hypothetical protein [Posidoniimonas polymericola]